MNKLEQELESLRQRVHALEEIHRRQAWHDTYAQAYKSPPALMDRASRAAWHEYANKVATEAANKKHGPIS